MHVIRAGQLDSPSNRIGETPALDECGGYRQAEQSEPGKRDEIDAGEDPDPREADRQEGHEAGAKGDRQTEIFRADNCVRNQAFAGETL